MWLTLLKGVAFKGLALLKSPWAWVVILALATGFSLKLYRGAREDVKAAQIACASAVDRARAEAAEEAAEAWRQIVMVQQEAVVRMSLAEAQQEAAARHWRQKYAEALKVSPACAAWSQEEVRCPVL